MSRPRRKQSDTYVELMRRIKAAQTVKALNALDRSITRHYRNGTITARELSRLDGKIMDAIAAKESKAPCQICNGTGQDRAHFWPDGSPAACQRCDGYGTANPTVSLTPQ